MTAPTDNPIAAFLDALRGAGIETDYLPQATGKMERFHVKGDKSGSKNGWLVLHLDGLPAGSFGNWKDGTSGTWCAKADKVMTPTERTAHRERIEAMRREREAEEAKVKAAAAAKAERLWNTAAPVKADHAYVLAKRIKPYGAKQLQDMLVIPARLDGKLTTLQFIGLDGTKRFISGGAKKAGRCLIGDLKGAVALLICEGWATGCTLREATGHPVAIAFDAGNLIHVAQAARAKFPTLPLILCADDDHLTEGNPGITKAGEAAQTVGGLLAVPNFGEDRPDTATDFNDLAAWCGLEAVKGCIDTALNSPPTAQEAHQPADTPRPSHQEASEKSTAPECELTVELIRACDVIPEAVTWLWPGWMAAGKMHVLGGAPGTGKTTISMSLAATVTMGGRWPDGSRSPIGNVVVWSGEDDPADTLVPRLALSGADLSRVYFVADVFDMDGRRSFDPAKDMEPLRRKLESIGDVRLLIVDPIVSAIAGDSHKNAEVRRGLQPLADLAASMRCALLGITHFSKGTGGRDPVERLTGSLAFGALARVVLVAAKHQEEGEDGRTVRLFLRAKSNIGPDDGGFEYDLQQGELKTHPGIFASAVSWGNSVDGAARDLLATADATTDNDERDALDDAKQFLRDLLSEGPVPAKQVDADIRGAGYALRTINRAKKLVGATSYKEGKTWLWKIEKNAQYGQDCQPCQEILTRNHGNLGNVESKKLVEVEI